MKNQRVAAGEMILVGPAPENCQECAVQHEADQPHNRDSLYYQIAFHRQHGRWPTWADACAHCSAELQAAWRALITEAGVCYD